MGKQKNKGISPSQYGEPIKIAPTQYGEPVTDETREPYIEQLSERPANPYLEGYRVAGDDRDYNWLGPKWEEYDKAMREAKYVDPDSKLGQLYTEAGFNAQQRDFDVTKLLEYINTDMGNKRKGTLTREQFNYYLRDAENRGLLSFQIQDKKGKQPGDKEYFPNDNVYDIENDLFERAAKHRSNAVAKWQLLNRYPIGSQPRNEHKVDPETGEAYVWNGNAWVPPPQPQRPPSQPVGIFKEDKKVSPLSPEANLLGPKREPATQDPWLQPKPKAKGKSWEQFYGNAQVPTSTTQESANATPTRWLDAKQQDQQDLENALINKYKAKTALPINYNRENDEIEIGDTRTAWKSLTSEFDSTFMQVLAERYAATKDPRYATANMEYVKAAIRDIVTTDEETDGLTEAVLQLPFKHRRVDWLWDMFGGDTEMEALIGNDPILKGVVGDYLNRFQMLRNLDGNKQARGSKIPLKTVQAKPLDFIPGAAFGYAKGAAGFFGGAAEKWISQLQTKVSEVDNILIGNSKKDLWSVITSPLWQSVDNPDNVTQVIDEIAPTHTGQELRDLLNKAFLMQPQFPIPGVAVGQPIDMAAKLGETPIQETVANAVGHLYGSIKAGSFSMAAKGVHVGAKSVEKAWKMTADKALMTSASKNPYIQKLAAYIDRSPQLKTILENTAKKDLSLPTNPNDAGYLSTTMRGAATFALSHVIEDFPHATPESIAQQATSGALFTSTGKAIAEGIFMPLLSKTSSVTKALRNPTVVKMLGDNYGSNSIKYIEARLAQQKDLAYNLSNTLANPGQGYIVQTSLGNDYDMSAFLIDLLIGAPAGHALARNRMSKSVNELDLLVTMVDAEATADRAMAEKYRKENGIESTETEARQQTETVKDDQEETAEIKRDEAENAEGRPQNTDDVKQQPTADPSRLVTRIGPIDGEGGSYFGIRGETQYEGGDNYVISPDARIADLRDNAVALRIVNRALNTPNLDPEVQAQLLALKDDIINFGSPIDYLEFDGLGLSFSARALGYDGARIVENQDMPGTASSIFVFNPSKTIRPGDVFEEVIQSKREQSSADPTANTGDGTQKENLSQEEVLNNLDAEERVEAEQANANGRKPNSLHTADEVQEQEVDFVDDAGERKRTKYQGPMVTEPISVSDRVGQIDDFYTSLPESIKEIWNRLVLPRAKDAKIVYSSAQTAYDIKTGEININWNIKNTPDEINAIVHEAFHKATADIIESNPDIQKMVYQLGERLKTNKEFVKWSKRNPSEAFYMLSNPHELLAGLIDNRHGFSDMLKKRTRLGGAAADLLNTKVLGYESSLGTVLDDFKEVLAQIEKPSGDSATRAIEQEKQTGDIERTLAADDALGVGNVEGIDDIIARFDNEMDESILGNYKRFKRHLNMTVERLQQEDTQPEEIRRKYAEFYIELQKHGINNSTYMDYIAEKLSQNVEGWDNLSPLDKASRLVDTVKDAQFAIDPQLKADLDALNRNKEIVDEVQTFDQAIAGTMDKRTLTALLGEENIIDTEMYLQQLMNDPKSMIDKVMSKVAERAEILNIPEENIDKLSNTTRSFVIDYIRNHQNLRDITPLTLGKTADGRVVIVATPSETFSGLSGKRNQQYIVNPDPFFNRLQKVKDRSVNVGGNTLDIFGRNGTDVPSFAENLINQLTNPAMRLGRMIDADKLIESNQFSNADKAGRQLIERGWFFTNKGFKANIFLDLSDVVRDLSYSNLQQTTKTIEEFNIVNYLNSERVLGVEFNKADVARALNLFDIWKMVELARQDRSLPEGVKPYDWLLRDKVKAKQDWRDRAMEVQQEMYPIASKMVDALRQRYARNEFGWQPEILHKLDEANIHKGLYSALNGFFHKVQDHGNENDLEFINNKRVKDKTKYWGVSFESDGYTRIKNVEVADAILQAANPNRMSFDVRDKSTEQLRDMQGYWRSNGLIVSDNGRVTTKQFVLSDAWAEANPEVWSALSHQDPTGTMIKPSELWDGGSLLINDGLHAVLSELNNVDPTKTHNIKYAYGNDWIYKSDMSNLFNSSSPLVSEFLNLLRSKGFGSLTVQSAFKSKGVDYVRGESPDATQRNVIYDHDGTLIGYEGNDPTLWEKKVVSKFTPEQIQRRYANEVALPELTREYDMFGDNAWAYVGSADSVKNFDKKITLNLDRHPWTANQLLDDGSDAFNIAQKLTNAYHNVRLNHLDNFQKVYQGARSIENPDTAIALGAEPIAFVRSMIDKLQNTPAEMMPWRNEETQRIILRGLKQAIMPGTPSKQGEPTQQDAVIASSIRALDLIYGNILSGNSSLRLQTLKNAHSTADKVKVFGKQYRLSIYTPDARHKDIGVEESLNWQELAAYEEALALGLDDTQTNEYIAQRRSEYTTWLNASKEEGGMFANVMPTGYLEANDAGVMISVQDLREVNNKIRQMRAQGSKVPYVTVGSKVIVKLQPVDGIQSFAAVVITGLHENATGIYRNHQNLTKRLSRDFDGDPLSIIYESDDWYRDDQNTFVELWNDLFRVKSYARDPYQDLMTDPTELRDVNGRPYTQIPNDRRIIGLDGFEKQLAANAGSSTNIAAGINALNSFYEATNQTGILKDTPSRIAEGVLLRFNHNVANMHNIKMSDLYVKTAQYDTYTGHNISPIDVFMGSRVKNIELVVRDDETNSWMKYNGNPVNDAIVKKLLDERMDDRVKSAMAAVENFNRSGRVNQSLFDNYVKSIKSITKRVDVNTMANIINRSSPYINYGQSGALAEVVRKSMGDSPMDDLLKLKNTTDEVASYFTGNDKRLVTGVKDMLSPYGQDASQAKYNPFNRLNLDPLVWQKLGSQDRTATKYREQIFHARELLSRTYSTTQKEIPIAEGIRYIAGRNGLVLAIGETRIPGYEIFQRDGSLHPEAEAALAENGLSYEQLFPRSIIGHVSFDTSMSVAERNTTLDAYLRKNPDIAIIRGTMFGDDQISRDGSFKFTKNPNFSLVSYAGRSQAGFEKMLETAIKYHVDAGRRVIIDGNTMGNAKRSYLPRAEVLDVGKDVKTRRYYDTRDNLKMVGKAYAMLGRGDYKSSSLAMQLGAEMMTARMNALVAQGKPELSKTTEHGELYRVYQGIKEAGGSTITPDGTDILQTVLANHISADLLARENPERMEDTTPVSQRYGRKLGLFNGRTELVKGMSLGQGRAGKINRLNKQIGRDIQSMDFTEIETVIDTMRDWVADTFPDVKETELPAFVDSVLNAFDPKLLGDMERGLFASIAREENGGDKIMAHKSVFLLQFMQQAELFNKAYTSGKLKDWRVKNGLLAEQSTEAMVRWFANDTKLFNGMTPIYDRVSVESDFQGELRTSFTPVLLRDTYDPLLTMPRLVSMESDTAIRHQYRRNYLATVKDQWSASIPLVREQIKALSPNGNIAEALTTDDIQAAKAYLSGESIFAREVIDEQGNVDTEYVPTPAPIEMRVSYNGARTPRVIARIQTPAGIIERATGDDGAFPPDVLTELAVALMPAEGFGVYADLNTTPTRIANVIKHAIIFKANNVRQSAFQQALADGIEAHVKHIRLANNDVDDNGDLLPDIESVFQKEIAVARSFANDMRSEAAARNGAGLVDNLDATYFVNYDEFATRLTEYFDGREAFRKNLKTATPEERKEWVKYIESLAEHAPALRVDNSDGTDAEIGMRVYNKLRGRLRYANGRNSQLLETQAKFAIEINPEESRSAIFDIVDRNIMEIFFDKQPVFNADVIFRRNQDVALNALNRMNAVFLGTYRAEKLKRAALGEEHLTNTVAEDNLLTDMTTDNNIYNIHIDFSAEKGLRKSLNENFFQKQQAYLDEKQLGIPVGTPISVTYATRADRSEMQTLNGRFLGVVKISNNTVLSKKAELLKTELTKELAKMKRGASLNVVDNAMEHINDLNKRLAKLQTTDSDTERFKDMAVVYNKRSGKLTYIDLASVTNMIAGRPIGRINGAIEKTQGSYVTSRFGGYDDLGKFLISDVAVKTMKTINPKGEVNTIPIMEFGTDNVKAGEKEITFFGTIGRDDIPPTVMNKVRHMSSLAIGNFASHYNHGFGKQTIGTGLGVLALPVALAMGNPMVAVDLLGYNLGSAGKKYAVNMLGNRWGFVGRSSQVFQNSQGIVAAYDRVRKGSWFQKQTGATDIGVAAALVSRRISQGVGVTAQTFQTDNLKQDEMSTINYAKYLASMESVRDIVEGWNRVLTKNDLGMINELIKKKSKHPEMIKADIRNGQLALSIYDQEQYIASLSELHDMNIDGMNQLLIKASQVGGFVTKPLELLARANAKRLEWWHDLGNTEQEGVINATAEALQEFAVTNANKPIINRMDAATSFASMGIDILQGKFDNRPVHMKTPMGRLWTLFSQYRRNFDRQSILGWNEQKTFWTEFYKLHQDDEAFRRAVITSYGVDIGDQRIEAAFMAWDKNDMSPGHLLQLSKAQKSQVIHAFVSRGLDYLLKFGLIGRLAEDLPYVGRMVEMSVGGLREQVTGSTSRIGELVGFITTSLLNGVRHYAFNDEDDVLKQYAPEWMALEEKEYATNQARMNKDLLDAIIPGGGFGISPVRNNLGLLGNKLAHEFGWLDTYKEPDYNKEILRTFNSVFPPLAAAGDVVLETRKVGEDLELLEKQEDTGGKRLSLQERQQRGRKKSKSSGPKRKSLEERRNN